MITCHVPGISGLLDFVTLLGISSPSGLGVSLSKNQKKRQITSTLW